MANIKVEIQGRDAETAAADLLSISGLTGDWETVEVDENQKSEPIITTIATIIGIVGGAIAIAEQVRKWYQEYRDSKSDKSIEYVLIVSGDKRLLLKNATLDEATVKQIEQLLED